jgi:tRNA pseudouridine38-40 synthase
MSLTFTGGCRSVNPPIQDQAVKRLALVVEYNGTDYAGSQRQAQAPTIQASLEEALYKLTNEHIRISLAGRTDTGAHARGQVVSFTTTSELPLKAFLHGLNYHLPGDIAVQCADYVDDDFDPRRHAVRREYEYLILNQGSRSPLWQHRAYHLPASVDTDLMNEAAGVLVGTHDFASFTNEIIEGKSTVRRVYSAGVSRLAELVVFKISANAFLAHQVRITAGTLLRIGQKKITVQDFRCILDACQPGLAGPTAPACGLYLNQVIYSKNEGSYENI